VTSRSQKEDEEEKRERLEFLQKYLERHYKIRIVGFTRLDRGVFRADKAEGRSWIVRVFPMSRSLERVQGDEQVLHFLEENNFLAERCAAAEAASAPGGRGVLVTEFVEGTPPEKNARVLSEYGEMIGRLASLPRGSDAVIRDAGSLDHYSTSEGNLEMKSTVHFHG
jgi:Ser/Thr protein kinase RdoA (MazF antagonist)